MQSCIFASTRLKCCFKPHLISCNLAFLNRIYDMIAFQLFLKERLIWVAARQTNKMTCASSKDSDQPGHSHFVGFVTGWLNYFAKIRKNLDKLKNCYNYPELGPVLFHHTLMYSKDADWMANSVDPHQIAPLRGAVWSWSTMFCPDQSVRTLRIITEFRRFHVRTSLWQHFKLYSLCNQIMSDTSDIFSLHYSFLRLIFKILF